MKFLVDENIEQKVVVYLRKEHHEVISISEISPSVDDKAVLKLANVDKRIILTNDKDFGELVFRLEMSSVGIVLLRLRKETADSKIQKLKYLLENYKEKIKDNFVVITDQKIRFRKFSL